MKQDITNYIQQAVLQGLIRFYDDGKRIEGSYTGVMGLPLYETAKLLRDFQDKSN